MIFRLSIVIWFILFSTVTAYANEWEMPERRREQFGGDFSYFLYPIASDVPGLGRAGGAGISILNIYGSKADFTGFHIDGDFSASGYTLLDIHLIEQRLIFDGGMYDFDVSPVQYSRGIEATDKQYILPRVQGSYALSQLTLSFEQRRYETYLRLLEGKSHLVEVRDSEGFIYPTSDTEDHGQRAITLGASIDLTDDHLDPRKGMRGELALKRPYNDDSLRSKSIVSDINLTGFLPLRGGRDTLVLNAFMSDAYITQEGETDFNVLQRQRGLHCEAFPPEEQTSCNQAEARLIDEFIASNRYGTATSLGGTQRLRSYDSGRFYAGHSRSLGMEYRWNITSENTPFDIMMAKGVRSNIQLAAFAEWGNVDDDQGAVWRDGRFSFGIGARVVLSGVILRADIATGDEGERFQMFIGYPWSMFSVDNP